MGFILGALIGLSILIGVQEHKSALKHEKQIVKDYEKKLQSKQLALIKFKRANATRVVKLNGIEVADLSGAFHD